MDSSEFSKGMNIFDKIVMELKKLKKFTEIKEVTFLYFDCSSLENLEILL